MQVEDALLCSLEAFTSSQMKVLYTTDSWAALPFTQLSLFPSACLQCINNLIGPALGLAFKLNAKPCVTCTMYDIQCNNIVCINYMLLFIDPILTIFQHTFWMHLTFTLRSYIMLTVSSKQS